MPTMTVPAAVSEAAPRNWPARAMRALRWYWSAIGVIVVAGIGLLQFLGPLPHRSIKPALVPPEPAAAARVPPPASAPAPIASAAPGAPPVLAPPAPPAAPPAGEQPAPVVPIRAPDPALLEAAPDYNSAKLPRIGPDGQKPMQLYAAAFNRLDARPRIAIMLGGIGLSEADSEDAISVLPAAISFIVSPYATHPDKLLEDMRAHGHEYLIGLPMEPANNPVNSEGSFQMMTGAMPEQNARNLEWAMSRIQGYVGATNALDGLRGERFSVSTQQMLPVLEELAKRGVFYVDAVANNNRVPVSAVPNLVARGIDLVVDEPAVRSEIESRLAQLEQLARERGAAVGLAGLPRPVTISRIAAWANTLSARGIALAPLSTVTRFPPPALTSLPSPQPAPVR